MDPFEEFARAVASGEPEKISTPETDPELLKCERCGEDIAGKSVSYTHLTLPTILLV